MNAHIHVINVDLIPEEATEAEKKEVGFRRSNMLKAFDEYQARMRHLIGFIAEIEERISNGRID